MGIVLGLAAGCFFSLSTLFARIGHRRQFEDDGLFMSVLVNVVTLGIVAAFARAPRWNTVGIVALGVGGVVGTVGGRSTNFRAVRLIGPSRANAFLTATPVMAAVVGWIVLEETVALLDGVGGALVIGGLLWLFRKRSTALPLVEPGSRQEAGMTPLTGYLFALAAPTFFGAAFVIRKWGLIYFPSTVLGAFIGAAFAFSGLLVGDLFRRSLGRRIDLNFRRIPWWYVAAGAATSAALLFQFNAFSYLPAWVVGVLQGTQGIWTLLFSFLFIRAEERLDRTVIGSVVLVVAGVTLIGL